jgi:hypothetical protein
MRVISVLYAGVWIRTRDGRFNGLGDHVRRCLVGDASEITWPFEQLSSAYHRTASCSGNALGLYSGDVRFYSRPGHRLSWQICRGASECLQANTGMVPRPVPSPSLSSPAINSTLCSVDGVVNTPQKYHPLEHNSCSLELASTESHALSDGVLEAVGAME